MGKYIKKNIKQMGPERILLSELLPSELILNFSNEPFYHTLRKRRPLWDKLLSALQIPKQSYTIPMLFYIKNGYNQRKLGLIHPATQENFIKLYDNFSQMIIYQCSKSKASLRCPNKVASRYFISPELDTTSNQEEIETDSTDSGANPINYTSFFTYHKYDYLYKFYDSPEMHDLERRFNYLYMFDISKCFYHIYTHSISWAVKNKEIAKKYMNTESFENQFDKLMQRANHNETNGIIVGPEISRIFAEIILQKIDMNVVAKLNDKEISPFSYEIRRYVDDYFIFTNDPSLTKDIVSIYKSELEDYKLYINESKTYETNAPFSTNISIVGNALNDFLSEVFNDLSSYNSNKIINEFRFKSKEHNVIVDDISGFFLHRLIKEAVKLSLSIDKSKQKESLISIKNIKTIFDTIFYLAALGTSPGGIIKISASILSVMETINKADYETIQEDIKNYFIQYVSRLLENLLSQKNTDIDVLNLLVLLRLLDNEITSISAKTLNKILDKKRIFPVYFKYTVILFYIKNKPEFTNIKALIEQGISDKLAPIKANIIETETFLLLIDIINCPYISTEFKQRLPISEKQRKSIVNSKIYFFRWKNFFSIDIKKKRFINNYKRFWA